MEPPKTKPSSGFELVIHQTAKTSSGIKQTYILLTALLQPEVQEKKNKYPSKSTGGLYVAEIVGVGLDFGRDSIQSPHLFIATPINTARPHGHNLILLLPTYPTATVPSSTAPAPPHPPPNHTPPSQEHIPTRGQFNPS